MSRPSPHVLFKLSPVTHAWDEQYAYVRGYILALEDVLGDLENMNEPTGQYTLAHARAGIRGTLNRARATLKTLEEMEDAQQAPPREAD